MAMTDALNAMPMVCMSMLHKTVFAFKTKAANWAIRVTVPIFITSGSFLNNLISGPANIIPATDMITNATVAVFTQNL